MTTQQIFDLAIKMGIKADLRGLEKVKKYLVYLIFFLFLFFIVFRNLYVNITTNLIDWSDYPFSVWVIDQNITKILSFNFDFRR